MRIRHTAFAVQETEVRAEIHSGVPASFSTSDVVPAKAPEMQQTMARVGSCHPSQVPDFFSLDSPGYSPGMNEQTKIPSAAF